VKRALSRFNAWCAWASAAILLVILATILYEVLARSAFNRAETWAFDLTSYGLLFVVFLAAAQTLEHEGHVRIDFLLVLLKPRARLVAEIGVQALSLVFIALLLWATARETIEAATSEWVSHSIYAIPLGWIYWIMPAATALLLFAVLVKLWEAISRLRAGSR